MHAATQRTGDMSVPTPVVLLYRSVAAGENGPKSVRRVGSAPSEAR